MPMTIQLIVAAVVLSSLTGCRAPELRPRLILQGEPIGGDFWLEAPFVLVVKIVRADLHGPPESIFQGGPKTLQLVKFVATLRIR